MSHGGHAARSRRDLLLPVLHAVQDRIGWISQPALNYVCKRLTIPPAEAYGVATFYALFATKPRPPVVAHLCDDIACRLAGAETLIGDVERALGPEGQPSADGERAWFRSPCLGLCDRAPAALVTVAGPQPATDGSGPGRRCRDRGPDGAWVSAPGKHARRCPAAGRPTRPPTPGTRGRRRSDVPRRLSRPRRFPRPRARSRDRAGAGDRRGHAIRAPRTRRRGVSDRAEVGGRGRPAGAASLPGVQRGRIGAWHVQGPGAHGGRPVRGGRGDGDRGVRRRGGQGLPLHSRRVPAGRSTDRERHHRGNRSRPARRARHRAAARRRRLHLRRGDGAVRVDRGQARRTAQQAAVPGGSRPVRQTDGGQQRRDDRQRAADRGRGRRCGGVQGDRHRGLDRPEAVLPVGQHRTARDVRGPVRDDARRAARARRRRPRRSGDQGDPARRGRRRVRRTRVARPAAHLRGHARCRGDPWLRRRDGVRRARRPRRHADADRPVLPRRVVRAVRAHAGSGRSARRSCLPASRRVRSVRSREDELVLLREVGQAMRDASICGLGQTASSAIESAFRQPGLVAL